MRNILRKGSVIVEDNNQCKNQREKNVQGKGRSRRITAFLALVFCVSSFFLPFAANGATDATDIYKYSCWNYLSTEGAGYTVSNFQNTMKVATKTNVSNGEFYSNYRGSGTEYLQGTDLRGNIWYFAASGSNATYVHPYQYDGTTDLGSLTAIVFPDSITADDGTDYTVTSIGGYGPDYRIDEMTVSDMLLRDYDHGYWYYRNSTSSKNYAVYQGYGSVVDSGRLLSEVRDKSGSYRWYDTSNEYVLYNTALKSVTIPSTVTAIEDYAFCYCNALTNIVGGTGITAIGERAFFTKEPDGGYCYNRSPDYINYYWSNAFMSEDEWEAAGGYTAEIQNFFNTAALAAGLDLNLQNMTKLTTISKCAFLGRTNIGSLVFPDSVATIGESAFESAGLIYVKWPSALTSIGYRAFARDGYCAGRLELPEGLKTVGEQAFYANDQIKNISIPSTVTAIGKEAFDECDQTASIKLLADSASIYQDYTTLGGDQTRKPNLYTAGGTGQMYYDTYFNYYSDGSQYTVTYNINTDGRTAQYVDVSDCSEMQTLSKSITATAGMRATNFYESYTPGQGTHLGTLTTYSYRYFYIDEDGAVYNSDKLKLSTKVFVDPAKMCARCCDYGYSTSKERDNGIYYTYYHNTSKQYIALYDKYDETKLHIFYETASLVNVNVTNTSEGTQSTHSASSTYTSGYVGSVTALIDGKAIDGLVYNADTNGTLRIYAYIYNGSDYSFYSLDPTKLSEGWRRTSTVTINTQYPVSGSYGEIPYRSYSLMIKSAYFFDVKGKKFLSWNTMADGTGTTYKEGDKVWTPDPVELYAQWELEDFTITLDPNKGSVSESEYVVTVGETKNSTGIAVPARTGYTFTGWYTSISGGTKVYNASGNAVKDGTYFNSSSQWCFEGDLTLYAHWTAKDYTVSFDSGGGTEYPAITVQYRRAYGTLPVPERTGYVFLGWMYNGKSITSVSPVNVAGDHTLTAAWKAAGPSSKKITYDSAYGELPSPEKPGYGFNSWHFTEDSRGNGTGTAVTSITVVKTPDDHTIHAKWTPKTFTVQFEPYGGTACSDMAVVYDRPYGYLKKLPVPEKEGYTFTGWYIATDGENGTGSGISNSTRVTILETQTLYAGWREGDPEDAEDDPYKILIGFNPAGGTVTPEEKEVSYPGTYGTLPVPVKDGHTFLKWMLDGAAVTEDMDLMYSYSHTLEAAWEADSFTVRLDGRGATKQEQTSVTVTYDTMVPDVKVPEKTGYTFRGYFTTTTAEGGGKQYYDAYGRGTDLWKETDTDVLYARWTQDAVELPEEDRHEPPVVDLDMREETVIRNDACDNVLLYADDHNDSTGALTDVQPYLAYDIYHNGSLMSKGGIPSTEDIAIRARTGAYMLAYSLKYNSGIEYVKICVEVPYRTQYEKEDETLVISEVQYAVFEHLVPKTWAYWEVASGGIFYPEKLVVKNKALSEETVTVPVTWDGLNAINKPAYTMTSYGNLSGHLLWNGYIDSYGRYVKELKLTEEQYIISNIIGTEPKTEPYLRIITKNAAWADNEQFGVRNDRLEIGDTVILDDTVGAAEGAAYTKEDTDVLRKNIPSLHYSQIYKSGIPLERTAENSTYYTEAILVYVPDESNVGKETYEYRLSKANEINIHTPVACRGMIKAEGEETTELILKEDLNYFSVSVDNSGLHMEQVGYGERDYTKSDSGRYNLAEEDGVLLNQVRFSFHVFQEKSIHAGNEADYLSDRFIPAGNWISLGVEEEVFYIPVTQKNGWYDVEFRSIAVNCPESEEEKRVSLQQKYVNTKKDNYIATDKRKIAIRSYLEDINIISTEDKTAQKELAAGNQALVLKKGYGFSYHILSRGEFYRQEAKVMVTPSFYWSSTDGTIRKKAYLYVSEPELDSLKKSFRQLETPMPVEWCKQCDLVGCEGNVFCGHEVQSTGIKEVKELILQQWEGYFYLPELIYCVTEENQQRFLKYAENQVFTGEEEIFEREGYLIVSFEISALSNDEEEYLFYMWENTEIAKDSREKGWEYCGGDVIRYDLSKGISDDFEAGSLE